MLSCPAFQVSSKRLNDVSGWELAASIKTVMDQKLITRLSISPVVSIMVDESSLVDNSEYMALSVILFEDGRPHVEFLKLHKVHDVTSEGLFNAVCAVLSEYGIPIRKVYGFGTDGASSMTGSNSGLATRVKKCNPYCIAWHCLVHQVALVSHVLKDDALFKKLEELLSELYSYFCRSPKRVEGLKLAQTMANTPQIKIKKQHDVRWLSVFACLDTLLMTCLIT